MDIEGGEIAALRGSVKILAERHPIWFIALHEQARNTKVACQSELHAELGETLVKYAHVLPDYRGAAPLSQAAQLELPPWSALVRLSGQRWERTFIKDCCTH